jgi:hypothetical protein
MAEIHFSAETKKLTRDIRAVGDCGNPDGLRICARLPVRVFMLRGPQVSSSHALPAHLRESDTASNEAQKPREGILVLAAIATMGLAADDSSLAQVFTNSLDRLAIQLAETVHTVARANGQSTQEFAELIAHREKPPALSKPGSRGLAAPGFSAPSMVCRATRHSTHFTVDAKPGIASAAPSA